MKSYPLTQTMLGMFLEWDHDHESTQYTLATAHVFPKAIDPERLVRAVEATLNAHDVFRMRFVKEDEEVRWTVDERMELKVERLSMSDTEADALQKFFSRGFDAFNGPFVRVRLIETPTTYRLFCEIFHLIMDGSSYRVMLDEIVARYEGNVSGHGWRGQEAAAPVASADTTGAAASSPRLSFVDYVAAEQRSFDSPEYAEAREAAIARFAGRAMSVPEDGGEIPAYTSRDYHFLESVMPRAGVEAFCKTNGLNPNLFFMGVFARTLALFANEKDVVFTTVNHGRGRDPAMHKVLGCCVKNLPVLGELKSEMPLVDYLRSFKLHKAGVYPFTHFCRDLNFGAGWCVIYQEGTVDFQLTLDGIRSDGFTPMSAGAGEFPGLQIYGGEKEFRFELTCAFGKYSRAFLARFLERFQIVAENFIACGPSAQLKQVPVLTADEQTEIMNLSYGGDMEYDQAKTFVDLFREQVALRPDATAVVDCETSLTYRELDERSEVLAAALVGRGVVPGDFVAIKLPRRVSFVVAMLAIEKCGAGYVPLDPEYPQDRLDYMVSDSQSKLVVDEGMVVESKSRVEVEQRNLQIPFSTSNLNLQPSLPAYMIYTSGSTGRPKGVVLSQRAVMNLIQWYARDCGVGPGKRHVHLASFSFDASVPDLFTPIAFGGELHILNEEMRKDLSSVGDYCVKHAITGATMSTKMGLALVNSYPELPLDFMLLGGEKMTAFAKTPVRMVNGYGPTEFAVCSSAHEVDQSRSYDIPIGKALPNTYSFIVDKLGQLVPRGMTGELALAGPQLADGYWHQPEKTSCVFVELPSILNLQPPTSNLIYLTGDLGRYNDDGELDFLGRLDFQVKLRGFRIEIGEIEHVASTFPGVGGVIALVKTIAGTEHLVLYYEKVVADSRSCRKEDKDFYVHSTTTTNDYNFSEELRHHLASKLTPYMVPDYFVAMEKLPQTPGGKIDRNALPLPKTDDEPVVAAEGESETKLLECVKAVLKRDDFGVTHDFNHLGLTSLGAMELVVKIKKTLGVKVTMRQLAEHPSVRGLAEFVSPKSSETSSPASDTNSQQLTANSYFPMTENQRGIYVDWLRNPNTTQYNIPGVVCFPNQDPQALAKAVAKIVAAHPAFRVHFANHDGDVMQELTDPQFANCGPVEVVELGHEPDADFFAAQVKPFAPTDPSLFRIKIFHSQPQPSTSISYLFLDIHHTVFDGVSMGVFLNELMRVLDGKDPQGEECTLTDAAVEEQKYLASGECEEDEKWFERYLDGAESTRFEENHQLGVVSGPTCGRVGRSIPAESITSFCKDYGVSPSDYLLTAFTELLKRIGRSEDVLINFVSAGRLDPSLSGTIGMFVKTLPIRGSKDAKTFTEAVAKVHLDVLDILDRSRVSYARLSERFGVRPDILFVYEGGLFELPHGASLIEVPPDTAKAPLSLVVNPGKDDFKLTFEYDRTLYAAEDIECLASMFVILAEDAASSPLLRDLPLVSDEEAARLLALSYGGDLRYDNKKTFIDLYRAIVITRSFALAVTDGERSLTYGELDAESDALARTLSARGVVSGDFVAVKLPRTVDFIVAVLAIQKLGAAYIPVDPAYPQDRIDYIVSDSGARLVIDESEVEKIAGGRQWNLKSSVQPSTFNLQPSLPAYMIYTSGSTGRPKGVTVPHRALRNMIEWVVKCYGLHPGFKVATHPSFSFDASVIDIFPTLAVGGELHILSDAIRKDIPAIRDYIVTHGVEGMTMSTQIGMALLDSYPDLPLKYLQCGGEKMMPVAKTKVKIVNGYGPTEFCVCSSYEIVDQDKEGDIPIGRPVPNTYSLIVDRYGHLLPQGAAGELALVGPQIADGYWHQPEKTGKAFIELPSTITHYSLLTTHSDRGYRTGDLARYNAEGKLEYLGRLDFQVKLRGFRIEIGEIESVAKQFPGVGAVAAEVRDVGGTKHLVLYYEVRSKNEEVRSADIKLFLGQRLTDYMVPDYFVEVEKMPMTPNGKIDRRKLKSPSAVDSPREYVEPANDTERAIAKCYGEILGLDKFGATDDFFDLGGTSIVAIKAVVALQKSGLDVQYGDVFKYKTPRALANLLGGQSGQEAAAPVGGAASAGDAASSPLSVYADYDYAEIDKLLAKTRTELYAGFRRHSLGDVLLTGATGYLGMHVLRYLLEKTDSTVYALVRSRKGVKPARRLDSQYVYYFGERIPKRFLDRLEFIEGDITDVQPSTFNLQPSTVINCAALVKHYVADDLMDRINVGGVENLIAFCEKSGARLVQTSTYSVGGTVRSDSYVGLDERHLYIGQESDNDYVRTKFLAERAVLAAIAAGRIRGKIMRLGNLMGREADGEFQMNTGANAFVNSLKTYHALGAYPLEELARPLEMSPIDRVAEAICLLATTPDDLYVFHPYNRYALDMGAVVAALNARGLDVDAVSREEFAAHVDALRNDPKRAAELQGILHYAGHLLENRKMAPVDNTWTTTVLYRLGFRWKPADDRYLANFFDMLDGLAVFG